MKLPPELFIVILVSTLLLLLPFLSYFEGTFFLWGGAFFIALGLGLGVPAGCVYHLLLFRKCKARGIKPERWKTHPHLYHEYLSEGDQKLLGRWFRVGAFFFMVTAAGCGLVFLGLLMGE